MNNIDFIKWLCKKADGFSMLGIATKVPSLKVFFGVNKFNGGEWGSVYYPLLLQRAIECAIKEHGIQFDLYYNKKTESWDMMFFNKKNLNYKESWGLLTHEGNVSSDYKTAELAKEASLKYIYEQVKS